MENSTAAQDATTGTGLEKTSSEEEDVDNSGFIWVPLAVFFAILLLSAMVYLMARNRRRLAHIYCKKKHAPSFIFNEDSDDSAMEQGDDPTECLLKGKLQIDNRYDSYQTTQVTQITRASQKSIHA